MNILIPLLVGLLLFFGGFQFYRRFISRIFGEDDARKTPAVELNDGVDYVPSPPLVVFSHHFAAIAGAGPIVGPVTAMLFGYIPVWLWVVLGGIFFGAVHDYSVLFVSLREKGKSVAEIARSTMGRWGFFFFILFTLAMIVLVTSAFLNLTAVALTSFAPASELKVDPATTSLHIVVKDNVPMVQIGGIASTSVIVMTILAPLIGYLLYRRGINTILASLLAIGICVFSVVVGVYYPVTLNPKTWMWLLSFYCFFAAGIPVWLVLQPRDFANSFILYAGVIMLAIGVVVGGLMGVTIQAPPVNVAEGASKLGMIWPFLFITVACGAISGFHGLVASGTVPKQVTKESHASVIGYGAMIVESIFALLVLLTAAAGLRFSQYLNIVFPSAGSSNPILAFALATGNLLHNSLGLPIMAGTVFGIILIEGFEITTLDAAVRLNRYLLEELWNVLFNGKPHPILRSYYFNALLAVGMMLYLAYTNKFLAIWPIFGSANQLLAALSLIAVSVWLSVRKKPYWFTLIPAIFMMLTTLRGLYLLLLKTYLPTHNVALTITDIFLMALSIGVIILSGYKLVEGFKTSKATLDETA